MRQRWPNTAHWQRLVSTFRATDGSRWRAAAAAALGVERAQLRSAIDRSMTHEELRALEDTMMAEICDYSLQLTAHLDRLRDLHRDCEAQRFRRIEAEKAKSADITLDEFFSGFAAEADIRAQFGSRIQEEDAMDARYLACRHA